MSDTAITYSIDVNSFFEMNEEEVFSFITKTASSNEASPKQSKTVIHQIVLPEKDACLNTKSNIKELLYSRNNKESSYLNQLKEDSIDTKASENSESNSSKQQNQSKLSSKIDSPIKKPLSFNNEHNERKRTLKQNDFYEFPSVGVGILLVHKDKILLGRRTDSGMYGLPGGWIEFSEEWSESAARELKEETGISMNAKDFKHIYTINSINKERNFHSVSCVMYGDMNEDELKNLVNKEPNKCYGWFWIGLKEMRNMYSLLFFPLREFLIKNSKIEKAGDFKRMVKERIDVNSFFEDFDI